MKLSSPNLSSPAGPDVLLRLGALAAVNRAILSEVLCGASVPQDPNDAPSSVLLECIVTKREKAGRARHCGGRRAGAAG